MKRNCGQATPNRSTTWRWAPSFGTQSKQNPDPVVGLDELRRLASMTQKPLVAIGGITRDNVRLVIDAGAASTALISDFVADDWRASISAWLQPSLC